VGLSNVWEESEKGVAEGSESIAAFDAVDGRDEERDCALSTTSSRSSEETTISSSLKLFTDSPLLVLFEDFLDLLFPLLSFDLPSFDLVFDDALVSLLSAFDDFEDRFRGASSSIMFSNSSRSDVALTTGFGFPPSGSNPPVNDDDPLESDLLPRAGAPLSVDSPLIHQLSNLSVIRLVILNILNILIKFSRSIRNMENLKTFQTADRLGWPAARDAWAPAAAGLITDDVQVASHLVVT
jgi:hypothetical protein